MLHQELLNKLSKEGQSEGHLESLVTILCRGQLPRPFPRATWLCKHLYSRSSLYIAHEHMGVTSFSTGTSRVLETRGKREGRQLALLLSTAALNLDLPLPGSQAKPQPGGGIRRRRWSPCFPVSSCPSKCSVQNKVSTPADNTKSLSISSDAKTECCRCHHVPEVSC